MMNMNKNNNDNIVIRKIRYDNITMKQHALVKFDIKSWKKIWKDVVDVLSTGCFTGCRAKYLKTVPGKWFKFDDVFQFSKPIFRIIDAELLENDSQVYHETDFNVLLMKVQNGNAIELRYNVEFPEESEPLVLPEVPGYVNYYICSFLNEYQLSVCGEFLSINWRRLYSSVCFSKEDGQDRMGKWIHLDTLIDDSCVGEQLPSVLLRMIDLTRIRDGEDSIEDGICDDNKVGLIVKLKDGVPIAIRNNHLYWMTDRMDEYNTDKDYEEWTTEGPLIEEEIDDRLIEIEDRFSRLFTPEYYAEKESQEKLRAQIKEELRVEMRDELKAEVREEFIAELEAEKARKLSVWGRIKKWCGW
jgi:hypothetical protein